MRRFLPVALLLIALAGCGDGGARSPFAESRVPPSVAPRFYAPDGWTWGYVRVGDGLVQRYGVSATAVRPRATVVILTGYSEPAEKWFETARELNEAHFSVWVLERQGQGGSERATPWRDLGHATSFQPDVAALKALVNVVIRPRADTPLVVLGHSDGALIALRAAEQGLAADGLILSSPTLALSHLPRAEPETVQIATWARRLKLGWLKVPGQPGWRRDGPDGFSSGMTSDRTRGALQKAWLVANPDLRMGDPSLGWYASLFEASEQARSDAKAVRPPVLMLEGQRDAYAVAAPRQALCKALAECSRVSFAAGRHELHMESDSVRTPWMDQVVGFVRGRIAAKALPHKG